MIGLAACMVRGIIYEDKIQRCIFLEKSLGKAQCLEKGSSEMPEDKV
jgi:hypothetical protein